MKLYLIIIFSSISFLGFSQETVPATGGNATGTGGSLSYTIGQVSYISNETIDGSVSQGVQQSYEITTTIGEEVSEVVLDLLAYPNPTNNILTLNTNHYNNEKLTYNLYDTQGKLMLTENIEKNKTTIEMNALPFGTYLLSVLDNNLLIKTFKIIKK